MSAAVVLGICWNTPHAADETAATVDKAVAPVEDLYPSWSPDGQRLVFYSNRGGNGFYQIFSVAVDGTGMRQLTDTPAHNRTPVFSPDGSTIVFQSERDGDREIYVMNSDGTGQRNLTHHPAEDSHPKWSNDGRTLIFDSKRIDPESEELFTMKPDGSRVRRITDYPGWDTYASISPDGQRILWRRVTPTGGDSESGRNSEIFIMNRDGSEPRNISNHPAFDGYPAWSADGDRVLFASNRDGEYFEEFNVFIMDIDGTDVTRLTETMPKVGQVRPMPSSDGRRIAYNRDYPNGTVVIYVKESVE